MPNNLFRFFARISAGLLVLHVFFFWAAERAGSFMGFEAAHFKDSALLFFLIAVYLLLESYFLTKEREVVEEEIISITEESMGAVRHASLPNAAWQNPYLLSAAIVGVALIIAGLLLSGNRAGGPKDAVLAVASESPLAQAPQPPGPKVAAEFGATPILNKSAKVQLIEFGDFECPFCGRFFTDSMVQIKKKYVDTGKIAYQHRDYPLPFHANAQKAAEAARCALEQSEKHYWNLHDWMYQNQTNLSIPSLKTQAKTLGINQAKFDQCLDSGKTAEGVKKDYDAGSTYGVSGTPSFFLNGELIVGAQPYATFEQKIEAALAQ